MAREIWIHWSRGYEYAGGFRDAIFGRTSPTNLHAVVQKQRMQFGIYMMLEKQGIEPVRDKAIAGWRASHGLSAEKGGLNLVYVGIVKSDQRDFIMRMREHERQWLHKYQQTGQLFLKFGRVEYMVADEDLPQLIEDAESVLVFEMQPYENTTKISSYRIAEDIIVNNSGAHAPLAKTMGSASHFA